MPTKRPFEPYVSDVLFKHQSLGDEHTKTHGSSSYLQYRNGSMWFHYLHKYPLVIHYVCLDRRNIRSDATNKRMSCQNLGRIMQMQLLKFWPKSVAKTKACKSLPNLVWWKILRKLIILNNTIQYSFWKRRKPPTKSTKFWGSLPTPHLWEPWMVSRTPQGFFRRLGGSTPVESPKTTAWKHTNQTGHTLFQWDTGPVSMSHHGFNKYLHCWILWKCWPLV